MRLGVGSHTFPWAVGVPGYPTPGPPLTAERLLHRAAELGVGVVQIADNLPLDRLSDRDRAGLLRLAERLCLDLEVGTRGVHPVHLLRYLGLARAVRSSLVRVVPDTEDHRPTADDLVEALRAVAPAFEREGVRLAVENHDRLRSATLADVLDRVGSPAVGLCLDTANSIGCLEGVDVVLRALGRRVLNLHIKDFQVARLPHEKGFLVEGRPAGRGQLDVAWLLSELRTAGADPNAIVELWPPPEATPAATIAKEDDWASESVGYLRRFIPD